MNLNNRPGPNRMSADMLARYLKAHATLLPDRHARILWHAHDQLSLLERQMDESERELIRLVERPLFRHVFELIDTMPGVGLITAATVLPRSHICQRWIGQVVTRWPTPWRAVGMALTRRPLGDVQRSLAFRLARSLTSRSH